VSTEDNTVAYIALGSNLPSPHGSPAETLAAAIGALEACGEIRAESSIYRTQPVGFHDQPPFLNAVVALETTLGAQSLLEKLLAIEQRLGRNRLESPRNGPRTLDLDLLLFGNCVLTHPRLVVPHPALAKRRFVLAPLAEIAPTLRHPQLGQTIAELLAVLPDEGENAVDSVVRLGSLIEEARPA
jgi:2-amino-4-hydroxy-6-hydroxymethyldihydropteridine diphosphokinase